MNTSKIISIVAWIAVSSSLFAANKNLNRRYKAPSTSRLVRQALYHSFSPMMSCTMIGGSLGFATACVAQKEDKMLPWACKGAAIGACVGVVPASYEVYRKVYQPYSAQKWASDLLKNNRKSLDTIILDDDAQILDAWLTLYPDDLNILDSSKRSLLHVAVIYESPKCVRLLLRKGLNAYQKDANGQTPMALAEQWKYNSIINIINSFVLVEQKYRNSLKNEGNELLNNLIESVGLTLEEWTKFKNTYKSRNYGFAEKEAKRLASELIKNSILSGDLLEIVQNVLSKSALREKEISVIAGENEGMDIFAMQNTLVINEKKFKAHYSNQNQIEAIIGHEVIHIMHEDDLIVRALTVLVDAMDPRKYQGNWLRYWGDLARKKYSKKSYEAALAKWYKFRERRADILSGLQNYKNIDALIDAFDNFPGLEVNDGLHPSMKERIEYLRQLKVDLAKAEKAQNLENVQNNDGLWSVVKFSMDNVDQSKDRQRNDQPDPSGYESAEGEF